MIAALNFDGHFAECFMSAIHWVIVVVIVLLVFGTSKLKNVGSDLGSAIKGFKKSMADGDAAESKQLKGPEKDADFSSTSQKEEDKSKNG
jgi:sec-independent protein translocase protein TatA